MQLRLPADGASIERARLAVLEHLAAYEPSPRLVFAVELILEETLTNIVRHAYRSEGGGEGSGGEAGHQIDLQVDVDAADLVLRFGDDGAAFDPARAPAPQRPATLAEAVPGGLGVMLVRRYARSVAYERVGGRNQLTVTVARA